jgi:predicted AAA+ superfamily ATPase
MDSQFQGEWVARAMREPLLATARRYPVVTLLGPRQSGKTTLVRSAFPDHTYCNMEDPELRALAAADPKEFQHRHRPPLILDEVQRVPELLSVLQVQVDERPEAKGLFILTGSHQPLLRERIGQSLAGRTSVLKLLPLSIAELAEAGVRQDRDAWLSRGCLPRLYRDDLPANDLYRNYYETYIERDVRQLIQLRNLHAFELFMKLLAGRVGQVLNLHALAGEVGVSSPTLREWLSVLEASFVVFRLPPYYENFGKRFIKSPKIYFTEPGLAAYLLEIRTPEQMSRDPLLGNLFENLVVIEALKARWNQGMDADLYYLRDQGGFEIDLLLSRQRRLFPVEIKAARTFHTEYFKNLEKFAAWNESIQPGAVIYAGDQEQAVRGHELLPFEQTASWFGS